MFAPRRFLPSISSLLALEAVDRLGSAVAAAEELVLTHGAVSRQLKVLEGQLDVPLIQRDGLRLQLNPAAQEYCRSVRSILQGLSQATLKLKANPSGGSLNLAILPAFGMHWLAPKLKDFSVRCPEVSVNLSTRLKPFDFHEEDFDAAIHFGSPQDWLGAHFQLLSGESVVPVCAPGLISKPVPRLEEILKHPLLHLESRPDAWERWFEGYGVEVSRLRGMLFDQFSTMAQASIHGLGIALLPSYLAEPEIQAGRLICAYGSAVKSKGSYYLVWPTNRPPRPSLEKFIEWLRQQLGEVATES